MQWVEKLEKDGFVEIKDFLPFNQAIKLKKNILTTSNIKVWDILTTPYRPLTRIKDNISSNIIDKQRHRQAEKARCRNQFSFSFYRSNNKHRKQHDSAHIHQDFADHLNKFLIKNLASKNKFEGKIKDSFFASFCKGQFINYHTDGKAGKYAFIYQLSSGWQKKYGGQLELYPKKIKFYSKILEPKFNCLALLKLNHPMPHRVKLLNNPKHKHRITISGWVE